MKIRHIVALLLMVLLLGGSSWGSACGLSCQLATMPAIDPPAAAQHPAMAEMSMGGHCPHMDDAQMIQSPGSHATAFTACDIMGCEQQAQVDSHSGDLAMALLRAPLHIAPVVLPVPALALLPRGSTATECPPGPMCGFDPLIVSLRI